jgi:hypothetical protein
MTGGGDGDAVVVLAAGTRLYCCRIAASMLEGTSDKSAFSLGSDVTLQRHNRTAGIITHGCRCMCASSKSTVATTQLLVSLPKADSTSRSVARALPGFFYTNNDATLAPHQPTAACVNLIATHRVPALSTTGT